MMKIKFVNPIKKGFSDGEFVRPILWVLVYSFIEYDFNLTDFRLVTVCICSMIIVSTRIE